MTNSKLPKGWEISKLTLELTDLNDVDRPQILTVTFEDLAAGFFPTVKTDGEVSFNPDELKKFAELAAEICDRLDAAQKENDKAIRG